MDYRSVFPTFPRPPGEYDSGYFQDVVRALDALVVAIRNPGEGRQTTIVLTNLQGDEYGLEQGTIFQVAGALRIPQLNSAYVRGLSATGTIGSVSVTTV
jgi:hypothetical protein